MRQLSSQIVRCAPLVNWGGQNRMEILSRLVGVDNAKTWQRGQAQLRQMQILDAKAAATGWCCTCTPTVLELPNLAILELENLLIFWAYFDGNAMESKSLCS